MHPRLNKRKSIRLKDYDYTTPGYYFITICTNMKQPLFGEICDNEMRLNAAGKMAEQYWMDIPRHYPHVRLDVFVIMPNHVHGILIIEEQADSVKSGNARKRAQDTVPLQENRFQRIVPGSVGAIARGYKIGVSKWFRQHTSVKTVWQKNYYEHIIRKEESLLMIQQYISGNPAVWEKDELYRGNI